MDEWKQMISVANIFSDATKILEAVQSALDTKLGEAKNLSLRTVIPVIVLKSFACEMYLKSQLSHNGNTSIPRQHNLYELYRNLNSQTKTKINKKLKSKMIMVNHNYKIDDIDRDIQGVSKAFEQWRYFYEDSYSIDLQFLNVFYDTLMDPSIRPPL